MKACPFCAESIQDEAVKCRYCGEFLDGRPSVSVAAAPAAAAPAKKTWYQKEFAIWGGFCCVGPLILPLVWLNTEYSLARKVLYTAVMLTVTFAAIWLLFFAVQSIKEAYQMLPNF